MGNSIDFFLRKALMLGVLFLVSASTNTPLHAAEGGENVTSIIVAYKPGTTLQDITHIEEKYGLKFAKTLAAANSRVYNVPAENALEKLLRDLGAEPAVRYAEVDQEVTVKEK
jgi:hypothetical protein